MDKNVYSQFVQILKEELVPAMGCTEPISLAYCTAKAKEYLEGECIKGILYVSPNIVKNVKSVTVPHTDGLVGLKAAFLAGLIGGNASLELEVLSNVTKEHIILINKIMNSFDFKIEIVENSYIFEIGVKLFSDEHSSFVRIINDHTNIVRIEKDNEVLYKIDESSLIKTDRSNLNVLNILEFAKCVQLEDVDYIIKRQIEYNFKIAEEGIKNSYGANIGKVYFYSGLGSIESKAKAYAAAGSDARMNGCELPVIINSGSGNQGITTSVPVIVYAKELRKTEEELIRSLVVSNLITIHLKTGIGTLSAYCGVVSAAVGAVCGIAYLLGKGYEELAHIIVNTLAIDSGIVCDGAKASCAAKIATSLETGFLGLKMQETGNEFYAGCGIVKKGVENTIKSVNRLASKGMRETDKEIIKIMLDN